MIRKFNDYLTELQSRLASAPDVLLGLDYDGTLTPLVDDPAKAILAPQIRETLQQLSGQSGLSVAFISGRCLDEVRDMVGVEGAYYAGNHGLDICGPGCRYIDAAAVQQLDAMAHLSRTLASCLRHIPGARIEDKSLTISVHFRQVAATGRKELGRIVEWVMADARSPCRIVQGNQVLEVRPKTDWHKGRALTWIRERLGAPNLLTFYLGDDLTDEDAFRALDDGITVKVGAPEPTAASYHLDGPVQVIEFLSWLATSDRKKHE